jgi:peptidyl-prolyl cis-trans isomerase C
VKPAIPGFAARSLLRFWKALRRLVPRNRRWRIVAAAAIVIAVLAASTPVIVRKVNGLPDGVALRVGDTDVTEDQVQHRIAVLRALYGTKPPEEPGAQDRFRRDSAKTVAVGIILENAARSRNIEIPDKSASDTLASMIDTQLPSTGQSSFTDLLRAYGASRDDVIDEIKRQQSGDLLFQDVTANAAAQVTDDLVRKYYQDHKPSMVEPEKRDLQNIVVTTEDQADQVAGRARSGEDFAILAKQYSLDQSTNTSGGELGSLQRSQLEGPYADAAFQAGVGSVFGPVQTAHGWNVGRVVTVEPAVPLTLDQIKDRLRDQLRRQNALDEWRTWLGNEIRNAGVEYADAYRPADPDAPPPAPEAPAPGDGTPVPSPLSAEPR